MANARRVFDIEVAGLRAVRNQLDGAFSNAVDLIVEILRRRGKIVVVGIGKSGNIGQKIAATLTSTGASSVVLNSVDALHGDLGIVNDGDLVLALSYSGESEELLNLIPALKRFSVKILAMTGEAKSSLARHSDLVLSARVPKEACPFNLAPTASTTAMLALGDALAMAVQKRPQAAHRDAQGQVGAFGADARVGGHHLEGAPDEPLTNRACTHHPGRRLQPGGQCLQ